MQITSAPKGQVIVAVDIDTTGSDRGLVRPALEQLSAVGTRQPGQGGSHRVRQPTEPFADLADRGSFRSLQQADQRRPLCVRPRCLHLDGSRLRLGGLTFGRSDGLFGYSNRIVGLLPLPAVLACGTADTRLAIRLIANFGCGSRSSRMDFNCTLWSLTRFASCGSLWAHARDFADSSVPGSLQHRNGRILRRAFVWFEGPATPRLLTTADRSTRAAHSTAPAAFCR
jgi:hypothetical protein